VFSPTANDEDQLSSSHTSNVSNKDWQFWQHNNKPLEITGHDMFIEMLHYIHMNPVVAGFVNEPENWLYSSASGYEKNNGLIVLSTLD